MSENERNETEDKCWQFCMSWVSIFVLMTVACESESPRPRRPDAVALGGVQGCVTGCLKSLTKFQLNCTENTEIVKLLLCQPDGKNGERKERDGEGEGGHS